MTALPRGIHPNTGMEQYHGWRLDPAKLIDGPISCSTLKEFSKNPYAWRFGPKKEVTSAMHTGSLLDMALTEPGTISDRCVISPYSDYRKQEARDWRETMMATGKLIVTDMEIENAMLCANAVRDHDVAGPIVEGAQFQTAVVSEFGNIPVKALIDIVPNEWDETLWDYKTTSGGLDDEAIRKAIGTYRYHWQAAFYRTGWNKESTDRHCERFGFIFQDPSTKEVRVVILHSDDMATGSRCVRAALSMFVDCAHRGIRSRYASGVSELSLMPYHSMSEEEWLISLES